ncbi:MAG: methyltransferase [Prolixibacteraceae bacterium]|nr:methyltransferase [Prolixibacteraceae bacterium]
MPNNYFQFKQFRIEQAHAAMKVGTDGVLLGSWFDVSRASRILDIGTGTGLIALMAAQRCQATIEAIDIDEDAIKDAAFNFSQSPWTSRLRAHWVSLGTYALQFPEKFDAIVSNPPFFVNGKPSDNQQKAVAKHTGTLTYAELLRGVAALLQPDGTFSAILPASSLPLFKAEAAHYRLFQSKLVMVKPKPSKEVSRVLIEMKFEVFSEKTEALTLETETHHEYSPECINLFRDFYLKL